MPSESSCDLKPVSKAVTHIGVPPPEPEQLKCPRCESMNTKFCYYNNYNFSQPRHFCKGCRRYWTHGGTLRDIPVGGGSRKNAKRSRTMASSGATSPSGAYDYRRVSSPAPLSALPVGNLPIMTAAGDGKHGGLCSSFSSLLGTHAPAFFNLNGFGLGLQTGPHDDMGFGLGRSAWPFVGGFTIPDGGAAVGGGGGSSMMPNAWQLQASEGGLLGGDCFGLSDHIGFARTGHALN